MITKERIKKEKHRISYLLRDAFFSIWHNINIVISSIVIVAASLCLFGSYILLSMNIEYISEQFKDQYALIAYIEKGTPSDRVEKMKEEISKIENVNNITFISEDQAVIECKKLFSENYAFLDGLEEDNPLRASFEITVKDLEKAQKLVKKIESVRDVVWVKNNQDLVTRIISSTAFMRKGCFWMMLIFGIVALFIVANTIKLLVTSRKDDILTMRYMGAENSFIIEPFIFEGIIIGVLGAIIAYLAVLPAYEYCIYGIRTHMPMFVELYDSWDVALSLMLYFIVFSLVLGICGSVYSVKRYIKA